MKRSLLLRGIFAIWKYPLFRLACNKKVFFKVRKDIARRFYQDEASIGMFEAFCRILQEKNISAIFLARIKDRKVLYHVTTFCFKYNKNIEVLVPPDNIGAGLVVYHNLGAVIRATSIGEDVSISQGVTIGAGGAEILMFLIVFLR